MSNGIKPLSTNSVLSAGANSSVNSASQVWVVAAAGANVSVWHAANANGVIVRQGSFFLPANSPMVVIKGATQNISADAAVHVSQIDVF